MNRFRRVPLAGVLGVDPGQAGEVYISQLGLWTLSGLSYQEKLSN